jgi:hypothetical protein
MDAPPIPGRRGGLGGLIASHPKIAAVLGVLILGSILVFLLDRMAQSRLERRIDAIRQKGEPVSLQDVIAGLPRIADEENMVVQVHKQTSKIAAFPIPEETSLFLPVVGLAPRSPSGRRLPPEQLLRARWFLSQLPGAVAGIHQALQLERGCGEVKPAATHLFPYQPALPDARLAAKTLALELLVAAEDGDSDRAAEISLDMCRVDRMFDSGVGVDNLIVRMAVDAMAASYTEQAVNLCNLNEETLRRLQEALDGRESRMQFKKSLCEERAHFIETVRFLQSGQLLEAGDDGSGGRNWWSYIPIVSWLDAAEAIDLYSSRIDPIERPTTEASRLLRSVRPGKAKPHPYVLFADMGFNSLARIGDLCLRSAGVNRALMVALAAERYRLAHGEWPADLQTLVPEYLAAVPQDPFDEKSIRYRRIPEGICVWTIGEDLVDNGGDIMRLTVSKSGRGSPDFGWVLVNPDLRGQPVGESATTLPAEP